MIVDTFAFERTIRLLQEAGWEDTDRGQRRGPLYFWVHLIRDKHAVHLQWSGHGAFGVVGRRKEAEDVSSTLLRRSTPFNADSPEDTVDEIERTLDQFESQLAKDRGQVARESTRVISDEGLEWTFTPSYDSDAGVLTIEAQTEVPIPETEIEITYVTEGVHKVSGPSTTGVTGVQTQWKQNTAGL